jgi:hypothetical protein
MAVGRNSSHARYSTLTTRCLVWRLAAALSAGIIATSGCGHSGNGHPTARLEGQVTVDNQPLSTGRIQFYPKGTGQPADAEIAEGHYVADLVPKGKVRVTFTAVKKTGKTIHEPGHDFPELVSIIPEQYQSGIEINVEGDNPSQDFKLDSKAPAK